MNKENSVADVLAVGRKRRRPWRWLAAGVVTLAVAGAGWLWLTSGGDAPRYRTVPVAQGDLVVTVSATGTLQPLNKVDVGSELSGTIASVEVDFNDHVKPGQILAQLDREMLEARLVEARATLESAEAKVKEAQATVIENRLALKRCEDLVDRGMCTASELDKLRGAFARAEAAEVMARAQVAQARAALAAQETNLRKSVIRAPIGGIVLNRQVEKGQTVAASFQTPVLFTLAEDLSRMELIVAVDEADIGHVRAGQSATFTVDAFPGRVFQAEVKQIRQAPKTVDGVVTYETVLSVSNEDLLLMPGMTATADIVTSRFANVLLVPNAALRFTPPVDAPKRNSGSMLAFGGPPRLPPKTQRAKGPAGQQTVHVLRDGVPVPVSVRTGATDGRNTQVLEGELTPGMMVITDVVGARK